ncbi:hypothetical protein [Salinigranum halophilum]|nr:hypothetical protein [Salinigranum halophilum]
MSAGDVGVTGLFAVATRTGGVQGLPELVIVFVTGTIRFCASVASGGVA